MKLLAIALVLATSVVAHAAPAETPIAAVAARASSALPAWKGFTFGADNLIDGRVDTSWQPKKNDTLGVGQWFEIDLGQTHRITSVEIDVGLQKDDAALGDLFCKNNRPAYALLFFDDGANARIMWTPDQRSARVGEDALRRGYEAAGEVRSRYVRVVITAAQVPVEWDDLAVAEVRVFGAPAPAPAKTEGDWQCATAGYAPIVAALTAYCAGNAKARSLNRCEDVVDSLTNCTSVLSQEPGRDESLASLPDVTADMRAGKTLALAWDAVDFTRHAFTLVPDGDGWKVTSHRLYDRRDGKAASPQIYHYAQWSSIVNPCWQKLGKTPPTP